MPSSQAAARAGKAGTQSGHRSESVEQAQLSSHPIPPLQQLQRTLGNRAVAQLVAGGGATVQPQRPAGQAVSSKGGLAETEEREEEPGLQEALVGPAAAAAPIQLSRGAAWADSEGGPQAQGGPAGLVIQRAIGYAASDDKDQLDADLASNPRSISRFSHAEALTRTAGAASDTGNFSHGSGSDKLENVRIKYNGDDIGYLRPLGKDKGNFDPNVKMHLVNSFLHPDANDWDQNWVWGPSDLNHAHDRDLERRAKEYHPGSSDLSHTMSDGKPIYAISYRTEVTGKASTAMDAADLSNQLLTQIEAQKPLPEWKTDDDLLTSLTVNDSPIATYAGEWTSAVSATVASSVESFLTIYGLNDDGNVFSEQVTLGSVADNDATDYRVVIEKDGGWFAGKGAFTAPESRKRRAAAAQGNYSKKGK